MSNYRSRLVSLVLPLAVLMCSASAPAAADDVTYPNGPIRFIVPATPGGTTDVLARVVAKHLTESWNVSLIVENRAGAGGVIGAQYVINTKPDGNTVLIAPSAFGESTSHSVVMMLSVEA